jgi:hypothetical protein
MPGIALAGAGAALIVLILLAGIVLALGSGGSPRALKDGRPGDCYARPPDGGGVLDAVPVSCQKAHIIEVFYRGKYPDGGSSHFPGGDTVGRYARTTCAREFQSYVGVPSDTSDYSFVFVPPDAQQWDGGGRSVYCFLTKDDNAVVYDSARGSQR